MSDNSFSTMFGPSAVGALNLIAGTTSLATLLPLTPNGKAANPSGNIAGGKRNPFLKTGAAIGDPMPGFDDCVLTNAKLQSSSMITMTGKNVGDLLNAANITWGWFQGGFAATGADERGRAICGAHHAGLAGDDAAVTMGDYIPHHEPFEYFRQTANPHHTRPSDSGLVGTSRDSANHQYDLSDFRTALKEGHLPTVTYLKAAAYQDAHPAYSDPIDEQAFLVAVVNALQNSSYWKDLAIVIAYDDSDGWYDHVMGPIVNQSAAPEDTLKGANCGSSSTNTQGQCGYGPRQPLLVISPYARQNFVDHRLTDQSSILRFVEDNWNLGRIGGNSSDVKAGTLEGMFDFVSRKRAPKLALDPATGSASK
jgi:phospholipase C